MNLRTRTELSIMMFLNFFVWGAWFVTMVTYLTAIKFQATDVGLAYSTMGWAAILSPFFVGMVADRFFPAQRVLGILHLIGGVLMYYVSTITDPGLFFWVLLAYMLCYMPSLALTNTIAFKQMTDSGKEFPTIRVFGTLGWIAAGLFLMLLGKFGSGSAEAATLPVRIAEKLILTLGGELYSGSVEATALPMRIAAVASIAMGLFAFALPNTPPTSTGKRVTIGDVLGLDALKLMKDRSFAVFVISSLLICIPLAFYYSWANLFLNESGMENAVGKMTLGQMSETLFLVVMPFFFARLGVKKMLLVGMLAWCGRYVCFAFGDTGSMVSLLYIGILLHGICYDFFFVTGHIYVDQEAPEKIRGSAQGLISLVTYGVGTVIGNWAAGLTVQHFQTMNEAGDEVVGHVWRAIWCVPAVMAIVVAVAFAILFKDKPRASEEASAG